MFLPRGITAANPAGSCRGARLTSVGRRFLLLAVIVCAIASSSRAHAGLDLTWNLPNTAGGVSRTVLGCSDRDSIAVLYACFQVPDTVRDFLALTAMLEIRAEADSLPAFWRFDILGSGCNGRGLVISRAFPEGAPDSLENPWGDPGGAAMGGVRGLAPDSAGARSARIACAAVRAGPTTLLPGRNYFAFALRLFMDKSREAGGECDGCRVPVVIQWKSAVFEQVEGALRSRFQHAYEVEEPGLRGSCVGLNGASLPKCDGPSPIGTRTGKP